jgi:hypothetical protein
MLAGAYVNGANGTDLDIYQLDDRRWIPIDALAELTGIQLEEKQGGLVLNTPLGVVSLPWAELGQRQGQWYITELLLWERLKIQARFDQGQYAMLFAVPWQPGAPPAGAGSAMGAAIHPDVEAPAGSMSLLRLRGAYNRNLDTGIEEYTNTLDVGGRIGKGTWILGARNDQRDDLRMNRYFWNRELNQGVLRLGTNFINLSPLLENVDYTGGQAAWNNRNISRYTDFASDLNFDSFLAEDVDVQRDIIRRDGPPGGIAELRINDRPVARTRIDLEGQYEFRNLPPVRGDFQKTEIFLYERSLQETPLAIVDQSRRQVREMVDGGELLLRAGLGEQGNALEDESPTDTGEFVGFGLARYGLSDWLTLQGVAQQDIDGRLTLMAGFRASLGMHWAWALDLAEREGAGSANTEIIGAGERWDFSLRSRYFEQDYQSLIDSAASNYDNVLNSYYRLTDDLRLGLVGRYYRDQMGREVEYLKPAGFWNLSPNLFLTAVPNLDGSYRVSADYFLTATQRFTALYDNDIYSATHNYNRTPWQNIQTGYEYSDLLGADRIFSQLSWYLDDNRYNYLQAGISYNGDDLGYFLSWNRILTPGIEFEALYEDSYRLFEGFDAGRRIMLGLRMDFAAVGTRLTPTDNRRVNFSRGGVSGQIRTSEGQRLNVTDVGIRINGQSVPQFQSGGGFYVGDLRPGVHQVEIDEPNLPIEMVPARKKLLVEVGHAAVTQVDFEVIAHYGIAGKVTDRSGSAMPAVKVVALSEDGKVTGSGLSGRFGYYRIDGLVPGSYVIRVTDIDGKTLSGPGDAVDIQLSDDFLFDINLAID